jgi:hypothetical protein
VGRLRQQELIRQEILLDDKDMNFLGPELILRECKVILRASSRSMTFKEVTFIDCEITAKQKQTNNQEWCSTALRNTKFFGNFVGNDFGKWPEGFGDFGNVEGCDFSGAVLDQCRIMTCDPASLTFPRWPCFTILHPSRDVSRLKGRSWPKSLRSEFDLLDGRPARATALVLNAKRILLESPEGSESEMKAALEGVEGILL